MLVVVILVVVDTGGVSSRYYYEFVKPVGSSVVALFCRLEYRECLKPG